MILPADEPSREDEVPSEVIDALNQQLAKAMAAYNAAADPEMGRLSPDQVFRLIHCPWDDPDCPLQVNTELPADQYESSPFFRRTRLLLCEIDDRGGVKATASKNLTRRFIDEILVELIGEEGCAEIRKYKKTINEQDVGELHYPRVVAKIAGLLRLYKGKFVVPKKKVPLLAPEATGKLFREIFLVFFRKFNLAYRYALGPESPALQSGIAYTLYRLCVEGTEWIADADLPQKILLPGIREEMEAELAGYPVLSVGHLVRGRIIYPLIDWGLLEGRYEALEGRTWKELVAVRNTPLLNAVLRFEFDS